MMSSKRCLYKTCYLPKNNNRFLWQAAYLFVSLAVILKDSSQFNFLSLFLYTVPILFDLWNGDMKNGILSAIKNVYLFANVVLCIYIILGFSGVIVDGGNYFMVVKSALILAGMQISKVQFLWVLVPDLVIPLVFYVGSPCRKNAEALEEVKEVIQESRANAKAKGV